MKKNIIISIASAAMVLLASCQKTPVASEKGVGYLSFSEFSLGIDEELETKASPAGGSYTVTVFDSDGNQVVRKTYEEVRNSDNKISEDEMEMILSELSVLEIFPKNFLEEIVKEDIVKIFKESVKKLIEINPETREGMLRYLMSIALSDKDISVNEVELIFNIAAAELGYSPVETAQIFSQMIQVDFTPSMNALC